MRHVRKRPTLLHNKLLATGEFLNASQVDGARGFSTTYRPRGKRADRVSNLLAHQLEHTVEEPDLSV